MESLSEDDSDAAYSDVKEEACVLMEPTEFEKILEKMLARGDIMEPSSGKLRNI